MMRLLCALLLPFASWAATTPSYKLSDTGATRTFTASFGEDSDFTGHVPAFKDNGNGTVTDRLTGLVWQKADGGEMTWEKAKAYAADLKLGGRDDWRLPTSMELFAVLNQGMHGPALDTAVFTRSEARYWWSDSPGQRDRVWLANTGGGIGAHPKSESVSAGGDHPVHVWCVAGASVTGRGPALVDNKDGTVTDQRTGLVWLKAPSEKEMTWEQALAHCAALPPSKAGKWRLPNVKELRSLSDDSKSSPSVDTTLLSGVHAAAYWSSTPQVNRPSRAWYVDFESGLVTYEEKATALRVIAVSGGQAVPRTGAKPKPETVTAGEPGKGGKKKKEGKR